MFGPGWESTLINLIVIASFVVINSRSLGGVTKAVAGQAVLLAMFTAGKGWTMGMHEAYFAALLTLIIKAVIMPYTVYRIGNPLDKDRTVKSYVNVRMSLICCAGLVVLAYAVTGKMLSDTGYVDYSLPAAVSMMLIGLFIMMTRKRATMQVVGLLIIENGVYLAGVGAAHGMPLIVELGIVLDALVGVMIMGILALRIHRVYGTINTEKLKNLRG